jgi:hypothetical protein
LAFEMPSKQSDASQLVVPGLLSEQIHHLQGVNLKSRAWCIELPFLPMGFDILFQNSLIFSFFLIQCSGFSHRVLLPSYHFYFHIREQDPSDFDLRTLSKEDH